jgi:hypothetical protein
MPDGPMRKLMKTRYYVILSLGLAGLAAIALWAAQALSPRIVARVVTPDGVEACVLQKFNWSGEPFTTGFVFRKPGGPWKWFYYDHQDWYWGTARVVLDASSNMLVVYRGKDRAITFDWDKELYTLHRRNEQRENPSSQPTGWSPATEGYR